MRVCDTPGRCLTSQEVNLCDMKPFSGLRCLYFVMVSGGLLLNFGATGKNDAKSNKKQSMDLTIGIGDDVNSDIADQEGLQVVIDVFLFCT